MSASTRSRLHGAWRFARGLSRGLRMGAFFPPDGRRPGAPAPGGTDPAPPPPRQGLGRLPELTWFALSRHRLPLPGLERPLRILHLTDVHLREPAPWLDTLCKRLRDIECDLVLLTGDVVTRGWQPAAVDQFLGALPDAPLGHFAIMGNWEHWSGAPPARWAPLLAAHGVRLLRDEVVDLGPLRLGGTDDMLAGAPAPAQVRAAMAQGDSPGVLMTHSPAMFPALAGPGVDLVLAGHSHGGQVRLPRLGALWVPRGTGAYVAGWYPLDDSWLFVSRGVGWSVAPFRLHCPPELALIELLPA
ncbi:MAG: metallophosphoesterase [Alphaproteobacteria bacterium]|nr:metallophosphoesterase [Alphaproteobacteria bacterium]